VSGASWPLVRIAAASDVHGHEFLDPYLRGLKALPAVEALLLAGDLTDRNDLDDFGRVIDATLQQISCPVIAVFGNNEWATHHADYRQRAGVTFLEDEAHLLESGGERLRIVGSTGTLDQPTGWQRRNLPSIEREYRDREARIEALLSDPAPTVLLTHYPPTHATMGAEKPEWRSQLGSLRLEAAVRRRRPLAVIHGHVHKGVARGEIGDGQATLEGPQPAIPVFNVALPVTRGVTLLEWRGGMFSSEIK